MNYLGFKSHFEPFRVFSKTDILKWMPDFDSRRLVEWQDKGYLKKIVNKWYCFSDLSMDEPLLFLIANRIYTPSYISFESALSYYGFIPEGVTTIHSATSRKTTAYSTPLGNFSYRNLKPQHMVGVRMIKAANQQVRLAEPEKAVLDYIYLNSSMRTAVDFEGARLNRMLLKEKVDEQKLITGAQQMKNQALMQRVQAFQNWLNHD